MQAGEEYDMSRPGDGDTLLKIMVIGHEFKYQGKKAMEFKDEIAKHKFKNFEIVTSSGKEGKENWNIVSVEVYASEAAGGGKLTYFKPQDEGGDVRVHIIVKEPEPTKPKTDTNKKTPAPDSKQEQNQQQAPSSGGGTGKQSNDPRDAGL